LQSQFSNFQNRKLHKTFLRKLYQESMMDRWVVRYSFHKNQSSNYRNYYLHVYSMQSHNPYNRIQIFHLEILEKLMVITEDYYT